PARGAARPAPHRAGAHRTDHGPLAAAGTTRTAAPAGTGGPAGTAGTGGAARAGRAAGAGCPGAGRETEGGGWRAGPRADVRHSGRGPRRGHAPAAAPAPA